MTWKFALLAGVLLLAGCDTRPEAVVKGEMRVHIRDRCMQGLYEWPEGVIAPDHNYCSCLVNSLTEGKSRSELIEMEQNAALYMEPGEAVVRQCTARAIAQAEEARRIECTKPGRNC